MQWLAMTICVNRVWELIWVPFRKRLVMSSRYGYYKFVYLLVKYFCYSIVDVMFVVKKIVICVDRLLVLRSLFLSPHFEAEAVYMSTVSIRFLKYAIVCTYFTHAIIVILSFTGL